MRLVSTVVASLLVFAAVAVAGESLGVEADSVMKPLVRVSTYNASGSGVLIYSEDREASGEFRTFVLSNWHVVSDAIHVVRKWDSVKKRYYNAEENDRVTVEVFNYLRGGRTVLGQPIPAEIRAYNEAEDLALLELDFPNKVENCAALLPKDTSLFLLQRVWAVGCQLGDDPIATIGHIMDLESFIDGRAYFMISANIVYGSSGGGCFVQSDGKFYFAGIPSRVRVMRSGQALTYQGFAITPERLRKFFKKQCLDFLLDATITPKACFEKRDKIQNDKPEE